MARPRIPLPRSTDRVQQRQADAIGKLSRSGATIPLFDGDGKSHDLSFDATDTQTLHHGLGRQPRGWLFYNLQSVTGVTLVGPFVIKDSVTSESLQVEVSITDPVTFSVYVY